MFASLDRYSEAILGMIMYVTLIESQFYGITDFVIKLKLRKQY